MSDKTGLVKHLGLKKITDADCSGSFLLPRKMRASAPQSEPLVPPYRILGLDLAGAGTDYSVTVKVRLDEVGRRVFEKINTPSGENETMSDNAMKDAVAKMRKLVGSSARDNSLPRSTGHRARAVCDGGGKDGR